MNQKEKVLGYMTLNGSITSLQAIRELGVTRLAAVIHLLKNDGINIEAKMITVKNRHHEDCRVASYSIAPAGKQKRLF